MKASEFKEKTQEKELNGISTKEAYECLYTLMKFCGKYYDYNSDNYKRMKAAFDMLEDFINARQMDEAYGKKTKEPHITITKNEKEDDNFILVKFNEGGIRNLFEGYKMLALHFLVSQDHNNYELAKKSIEQIEAIINDAFGVKRIVVPGFESKNI